MSRLPLVVLLFSLFGFGAINAQAVLPVAALNESVPTLAPMLKQAAPAVVNISISSKVKVRSNPLLDDPFFREFFRHSLPQRGQERERTVQSIGSGVIVDAKKGLVLTNHHVTENADEIFVTLQDKRRLKAELIGSDKATDIAVLKIPAEKLVALPLGDSDAVEAGDFTVAIGNPFGLGHTVTAGIISAVGRSGLGLEGYEDLIQTDAAINPGNSGGALINLKGELIGINNMIFSRSGGNIGIGFAIPVNTARGVMDQLVEHGEVQRGVLGVQIQDLTPELADAIGAKTQQGALVSNVMDDSPAKKAGIREGDIITHLDGQAVANASSLRTRVGLKRLGETVRLTVLRDGKPLNLRATIGKASEESLVADQEDDTLPRLDGARFSSGLPENHPLQGKVQGVLVASVEPGSNAWQAGLRNGDVIVSVNKKAVKTVAELSQQVKNVKGSLLLYLRRDNGALYIVIN